MIGLKNTATSFNTKQKNTGDNRPVTTINYKEALVWLNAFNEMIYEGECQSVYKLDGNIFKDASDPAVNEEKIKTITAIDTKGFRLPTPAEYEFVARGGLKSTIEVFKSEYVGTDKKEEAEICKYAQCNPVFPDSTGQLAPYEAGGKMPNALNLYDMTLNAGEFIFNTDYRRGKILHQPIQPLSHFLV